jgi:hypothetical protein
MLVVGATGGHQLMVWGIALVAIGLINVVFRRFYARRDAALNTARRETAPGPMKGLYRQRDPAFYMRLNLTISGFFIVLGIILIATHA